MGFMPPAWTPKRTGNSLPKRDETRASAHDAWAGPCWMWPTTSEDVVFSPTEPFSGTASDGQRRANRSLTS